MIFNLLAWMFDAEGWYNSPFIVPVAGCAMIGSIVVAGIWSKVRTREIRSHERLARIAQGLPVEPDWEEATVRMATAASTSTPGGGLPRTDGSRARRAGVVLVSIGMGLMAFFFALAVILHAPAVLCGAAAGLIPMAIGIGFLVDARLRKTEFEKYWQSAQFAGYANTWGAPPVAGAGAAEAPVPPPPPVGVTPAQASDWRPLH